MLPQPSGQEAALAGGRAAARDRAAKLLGLLDFSAGATDAEGLERALSVVLLSLMGEFAAPGGLVLLRTGDDRLEVKAAKGPGARDWPGRTFEVDRLDRFDAPVDGCDLGAGHPLQALAVRQAIGLVAPIRHQDRVLGLLVLPDRPAAPGYQPGEVELTRLVAGLLGTVVANHQLYSELKDANRRLRRGLFDLHTLFDLSRELGSSYEPQTIYRLVAQTAMAHVFASPCLVLLAADGGLKPVYASGLAALPVDGEPVIAPVHVDANGSPTGPAVDAYLARTGCRWLVPLRAGSTTRGFLAIGPRRDGRALGREEVEFLSTLGHQAVTALDNLRLHKEQAAVERELELARSIQDGLLPRSLPAVAGYELSGRTEPCFKVGGDYYDAFLTPAGLLLALADVAGKSISAALLMTVLQATLRALGQRQEPLVELVQALNRRLCESTQVGRFATLFLARLEPAGGRLRFVNAGHNYPMVVRRDGSVERLRTGGMVLGILDRTSYAEGETTLAPGDLLFLFTDGISEAMSRTEEEFGEERLLETLAEARGEPPARVLDRVQAAVRRHAAGAPQSDDMTLLAVRRRDV